MSLKWAKVSYDVAGVKFEFGQHNAFDGQIDGYNSKDFEWILSTGGWEPGLVDMICGAAGYLQRCGRPGSISIKIE